MSAAAAGRVPEGRVQAVHRSDRHGVRKQSVDEIRLLAGIGVEGDVHAGATVKHRSRASRSPAKPNLRQVHLIAGELHEELAERGFRVRPGEMAENVTTRGLDLLALPAGARLALGDAAVVELTGLRNPCRQLEEIADGLMEAVLDRDEEGELVRKAGVMAVVLTGGLVRPGDRIRVALPPEPWEALAPV